MNVTHVIVHDTEQVREIMRESQLLANDFSPTSDEWSHVFCKACDLLGQRQTIVVQDAPVAVDLSKLRATG